MKEIVQEINKSDTFAKIIEVGAGTSISNIIFRYSGASKTIYSVESPYSREAFDRQYGIADCRAISAERLYHLNNSSVIKSEFENDYYNTLLSATFQIGENNDISTHGWYSLNINGKSKYYHVSIYEPIHRDEYMKVLGEIGVLILHSKNESTFTNSYIDIILNDDLSYDYENTLQFATQNNLIDIGIVFKQDGTIDRLESITRGKEKLIIYKGSFNPPTVAHIEIAENVEKIVNEKCIFSISINTYGKGLQEVDTILDRIKMINILGYDVLIYNRPLFKDISDFLRYKYKNEIIYPMGVDTINRITEFYDNIQDIEKDFKNVKFICNLRENYTYNDMTKQLVDLNIMNVYEIKNSHISSTMVRNGEIQYVPSKIQELIKK